MSGHLRCGATWMCPVGGNSGGAGPSGVSSGMSSIVTTFDWVSRTSNQLCQWSSMPGFSRWWRWRGVAVRPDGLWCGVSSEPTRSREGPIRGGTTIGSMMSHFTLYAKIRDISSHPPSRCWGLLIGATLLWLQWRQDLNAFSWWGSLKTSTLESVPSPSKKAKLAAKMNYANMIEERRLKVRIQWLPQDIKTRNSHKTARIHPSHTHLHHRRHLHHGNQPLRPHRRKAQTSQARQRPRRKD